MEPKTKQYLLVTVVGVTLFVALLRLSTVLAFAAELVDLVLKYYDQLSVKYRKMIPLKMVYIPVPPEE